MCGSAHVYRELNELPRGAGRAQDGPCARCGCVWGSAHPPASVAGRDSGSAAGAMYLLVSPSPFPVRMETQVCCFLGSARGGPAPCGATPRDTPPPLRLLSRPLGRVLLTTPFVAVAAPHVPSAARLRPSCSSTPRCSGRAGSVISRGGASLPSGPWPQRTPRGQHVSAVCIEQVDPVAQPDQVGETVEARGGRESPLSFGGQGCLAPQPDDARILRQSGAFFPWEQRSPRSSATSSASGKRGVGAGRSLGSATLSARSSRRRRFGEGSAPHTAWRQYHLAGERAQRLQ